MSKTSENNKRIAKNTMLLYFRMLLTMGVSLYTSRVILNILGVTDYGIYSVVGGVITMFSFITSSLGCATSRFITFELGKGDILKLKKTFSNIMAIHILFAILLLIIGETIGLWFVYNELQIPEDRFFAALWVYQFSVLTAVISVISVPYNSAIIAHEKMKAFAYISIIDAFLKLVIVYLLLAIPYDKLIIYAFLYFCIQLFDRIVYGVYCSRNFEEINSKISIDKKQFKEIFGFAFWTMNGNLAVVGYTQGLNILLNMFFGVVVNASRGIAVQVQSVVRNFCYNFQMAINPQITKSYAVRNFNQMHKLVTASSKYSFLLLYFISLPLIFEAPLVLQWWLGIVPEDTIVFLRWVLCISMLVSLSNPLVTSIFATGDLRKFQLIEGSILLSIVPVAYLLLKYSNVPAYTVFGVQLAIEFITQIFRVAIVLPKIGMKTSEYCNQVIFPITKVVLLSLIAPSLLYVYCNQSIFSFFLICTTCVLSVTISLIMVGCNKAERFFIINKVRTACSNFIEVYKKL